VVEGNKFFDEANIRSSLPSVQPGHSPNIRDIADNLRVANENPAKQTTVLLRGGAEEGQVDAVVRVTDERPSKYSVTFDNTGTAQTGIYRVGVGFQYGNVWNRDHVLSMQYVTSPANPEHPNTTKLYRATGCSSSAPPIASRSTAQATRWISLRAIRTSTLGSCRTCST